MEVQRKAVVVNVCVFVCCYFELATHKREGDRERRQPVKRLRMRLIERLKLLNRERQLGRETDKCKRLSKQDSKI